MHAQSFVSIAVMRTGPQRRQKVLTQWSAIFSTPLMALCLLTYFNE